MVDSDDEENAEDAPENYIQWEKFQCAAPNGYSLVVIRDKAFNQDQPIVFPPCNHENLHHLSIPKLHHHHDDDDNKNTKSFLSYGDEHATSPSPSSSSSSSLSSSECFSPSDYNSLPNTPLKSERSSGDVAKCCWWRLGARALHAKVNGVWMYFRSFRFSQGLLSTFQTPVGIVAVLLAFLYFRWRRRQQSQPVRPPVELGGGSNEHFLRVIREKDERINQLLNQIARLNEVLLDLHRVPSSKTG